MTPSCRLQRSSWARVLGLLALSCSLACLVPSAWAVNPMTGPATQVALCMGPTHQGVFNPLYEYTNPIRYMLANERMGLTVRGVFYSLDVDGAVEEAIAEWAMAIPSIRFQRRTAYDETPDTLKVLVDKVSLVGALGAGFRRGTLVHTRNPSLMFFTREFQKITEDAAFDANLVFLASSQVDDYLKFLLRLTAKHEIGHLLGFMHTPLRFDGIRFTADALPCPGLVYYAPTNLAAGPPIMAPNMDAALRLMYDYYGRPLELADIQIAPQEAAVGRAVFDELCPEMPSDVRMEAAAGPPRNRRALEDRGLLRRPRAASEPCPAPTSVFIPSLPALLLPLF